jgi:SAM-dependent methyltransferase
MFLKPQDPYRLVVGIVGVKLGDRLLHIGCAQGGRLAALAARVGLSGRAVALVPDERSAARARAGAADAGVLIEIDTSRLGGLAYEAGSFDLVVLDDTDGLLDSLAPQDREAVCRDMLRVLRPGGRALIISAGPPSGLLARVFGGGKHPQRSSPSKVALSALESGGFKLVRNLAEREGLVFFEGVKPREAA